MSKIRSSVLGQVRKQIHTCTCVSTQTGRDLLKGEQYTKEAWGHLFLVDNYKSHTFVHFLDSSCEFWWDTHSGEIITSVNFDSTAIKKGSYFLPEKIGSKNNSV
jgi:hypothetical protein